MMHAFRSVLLVMQGALLCVPALSQDYYPLQVGNAWHYRSIFQTPGDSTIFSSFRVLRDSLFSNGHRYFVLDSVDILEARFVRVDSAFICYLNPKNGQDQKVFNTNANLGDTAKIALGIYFTVQLVAADTIEVFGFRDRVLTFRLDGLVSPSLRRISKRFGPLYEERCTDGGSPWPYYGRQLVGCTIDGRSNGRTVDVGREMGTASEFVLRQNYPNPFNPGTRIDFSTSVSQEVSLTVYDILGRQVRTLVSETLPIGEHPVWWDGRDDQGAQMTSGVYLYELKSGLDRQVRRMVLLK
jgi:hypothetical protein